MGEALDLQRGTKTEDASGATPTESSSPFVWIVGIAVVVGIGAWIRNA